VVAAMRRGCVQAIFPSMPRPAARQNLGIWVVFARTGLAGNDGHRMLSDAVDDGRFGPGDGQVDQVLEIRHPLTAPPPSGSGIVHTRRQGVQPPGEGPVGQFFARPHQSIQFTAQGDGIAVHHLFEQRPERVDLFSGIGHGCHPVRR
jgi:hypothetical protein